MGVSDPASLMPRRVPGVGSGVGGSTEVMNLFHEGKDGKSSHAARTVDGGAAMMMLVLIEGIEESCVEVSGVQGLNTYAADRELWLW